MNVLVEDHVKLEKCEIYPSVKVGYRTEATETTIHSFTTIGRYCSIGQGCTLNATRQPTNEIQARLIIGNDVSIGKNVMIMSGVTIGDGSVIAAGSIVTNDVEPYEVVGGSPAKHQQYRFEQPVAVQLKALEWWRYNEEFISSLPHDDVIATMQLLLSMTASARKEKTLRAHHRERNLPYLKFDPEKVIAFADKLR